MKICLRRKNWNGDVWRFFFPFVALIITWQTLQSSAGKKKKKVIRKKAAGLILQIKTKRFTVKVRQLVWGKESSSLGDKGFLRFSTTRGSCWEGSRPLFTWRRTRLLTRTSVVWEDCCIVPNSETKYQYSLGPPVVGERLGDWESTTGMCRHRWHKHSFPV